MGCFCLGRLIYAISYWKTNMFPLVFRVPAFSAKSLSFRPHPRRPNPTGKARLIRPFGLLLLGPPDAPHFLLENPYVRKREDEEEGGGQEEEGGRRGREWEEEEEEGNDEDEEHEE